MKRVIIVHGWGGSPQGGWIPWLKEELESRGYKVITPQMPNTDNPTIEEWVPYLAKIVGTPDKDTILVGHSIGCQTIMRYLEKAKAPVAGVVLVAGWFNLFKESLHTKEEIDIAHQWVNTPIDLKKVKKNAGTVISIFSDDDPYVALENWKAYEQLGNIIVEKGLGHIEGMTPSILTSVLRIK